MKTSFHVIPQFESHIGEISSSNLILRPVECFTKFGNNLMSIESAVIYEKIAEIFGSKCTKEIATFCVKNICGFTAKNSINLKMFRNGVRFRNILLVTWTKFRTE